MTQSVDATRPSWLAIAVGVAAALAVSAMQHAAPAATVPACDKSTAAEQATAEWAPVMGSGASRSLPQYTASTVGEDVPSGGAEVMPVMGTGQERPLAEFGRDDYEATLSAAGN